MKVYRLFCMLFLILSLSLADNMKAQSCNLPSDLQVTTSDWQNFQLSWTGVPNAVGYNVMWQLNQGPIAFDEIAAAPTSYSISLPSPLLPSDILVIQIQTICGNGNLSINALTVVIQNYFISAPSPIKPIYIIIDDFVIFRDLGPTFCETSCGDWFCTKLGQKSVANGLEFPVDLDLITPEEQTLGIVVNIEEEPTQGSTDWIGQSSISASRYSKKDFCVCMNDPLATEASCLEASYIDEIPRGSIVECTDRSNLKVKYGNSSAMVVPNPFDVNGFIMVNTMEKGPADLRLYDTYGRLLYSDMLLVEPGQNRLGIQGQELPSGIVYFEIQLPSRLVLRGKLIKM